MTTRALLTLTLALAAPFAQGQEPTSPTTTPAPEPAATPAGAAKETPAVETPEVKIKEAGSSVKKGGNETLSVDFPDEDLREILRSVADLFDLNIVVPDTLVGKTSVKLRDVTWRQIFEVVLGPAKYTYIEQGNIIKVVSVESLQMEPTKTELFILNYARAGDVMPTIGSLVDSAAGGKIVVDSRSNALVITERPTRLERIRPILETLDKATDQVMIESKFIEVTDKDVRDLGVKWGSLQNFKLGVRGAEQGDFGTYDRTQGQSSANGSGSTSSNTTATGNSTNSGTTAGSTTSGSTGSNTSNTVTSTNGVITTGSATGTNSALGTTTSTGVTSGTAITNAVNGSTALNALQQLTNTGGTSRTLNAVFNSSDFSVILSALNTLADTRIVSNPTVVTLNNTEAAINVGEEFPIPNYTYNQERGTFEVSGFTYRPIGIILKVTPQVNARGFIKLTLEPEVSQRNGETTFGGAGGAAIPIIATRKAKTNVSLKDGYTMGIGGMIRKQTTDSIMKVPFLGDIPFIGNAFKHKSKNAETTNLLIFITAKVVSADGATIEHVVDPRQAEEMKLQMNDLPGYRKQDGLLLPPAEKIQPKSEEKKSSWFRRSNSKK